LKKYKSTGSNQIPAELIQAREEILLSAIHRLNTFVWNREEVPDQWKESIIIPVHKPGDKTEPLGSVKCWEIMEQSYNWWPHE
jgi:hypothetical protein